MDRRYLSQSWIRRRMTDRCVLFSRASKQMQRHKSRKLQSHCKQRSSHSVNVMRRIASCDIASLLTGVRLYGISCAQAEWATRGWGDAKRKREKREGGKTGERWWRISHKRNTAACEWPIRRNAPANPEIIIAYPLYNAHTFPVRVSIIFFAPFLPRRT